MTQTNLDYADALKNLLAAGKAADIDLMAPRPAPDQLTAFPPPVARQIAAEGYPASAELPWIVEELHLYGVDELAARQEGYRTEGGHPAPGWSATRWVIADWTANPISIGEDGTICYARHGEGEWHHVRIARDLPAFFNLLAAWLRYFVVERGGNIFNDDFGVDDVTRDAIRTDVLSAIDPEDREAGLEFLLGE